MWIFIPILIHIILAIPLSQLINLEVRYLNWAAVGIWIITSSMAAFLETSNRIRKIQYETNQIDILLHSPTTNVDILLALFFRGTIIGLIQFIFSILITLLETIGVGIIPGILAILLDKNILYAPDYVINAGGLINIYNELQPEYNRENVYNQVDKIYDSLLNIFDISKKENKPTNKVSDRLAINIINKKKQALEILE